MGTQFPSQEIIPMFISAIDAEKLFTNSIKKIDHEAMITDNEKIQTESQTVIRNPESFFKKLSRRIKRRLHVTVMRTLFLPKHQEKIDFPRKFVASEETAVKLFLAVLENPGTTLMYDTDPEECLLESADKTLYLFFTPSNIKIVNTVVGYDIHLQPRVELFLRQKFKAQLKKRIRIFKSEATKKVQVSLQKTLDKVSTVKEETETLDKINTVKESYLTK